MPESLRFAPLIGRIFIALLFVPGGFEKISDFKGAVGYATAHSVPLPALAIVAAIVIEFGCGLLLLLGYKTRWAAGAIALFCVVAALFFHADFAEPMERIAFFKDLAIAGGLLSFVYSGAGPFSMDNRR